MTRGAPHGAWDSHALIENFDSGMYVFSVFFQKSFKKSAFYSPCCQLIKYSQDDDHFFINGYVKIIKLILHVSLLPPFTRHISRIVLCLCVMCLMNPNLCVISFVKCVDCVLKLWINLSNFIWIIVRYDLNNKF